MLDRLTILRLIVVTTICFHYAYGQIDTNKRYLEKLIIKADTSLTDLTVILKNKSNRIEISNRDTIYNLSFNFRDNITLTIKFNDIEFKLDEFNLLFPYSDFAHIAEFSINKKTTSCTKIAQYDGRTGNVYSITLNCDDINKTQETNLATIFTSSKILADTKVYNVLTR